jgi:aryl-alcohol dehydrogenase-like predicted oxidoreductase
MKLNKPGASELRVSEICLGTMTWGEQNSERDAETPAGITRYTGATPALRPEL